MSPVSSSVSRASHNEEGNRFWRKSNENMVLFVEDANGLAINADVCRWASLSQIKRMILLEDIVGPHVRTVIAPLRRGQRANRYVVVLE